MAKKKEDLREILIKAKFYRTFALIFITLGIFIFCFLYISNIEGRLFDALSDPFTISVFLVPFIPAAFLSWMADRLEQKYHDLSQKKK